MRKVPVLTLLAVMITTVASSQVDYWSANNENRSAISTDKAVARVSYPREFKLFNLNAAPLRQALFSIVDNQAKRSTNITLPNAAGNFEQFEVFEASNFEPELQARFPEIRAFSGRGITDKFATLKLSISPQGIQTMVFRTGRENEFIEAYSADHNVYAVFRSQRAAGALPWTCSTPDEKLAAGLNTQVDASVARSGNNLKTIRLAQSVTAEYSNYFGATSSAQVSLVLAAVNATMTRCNGVYEKDLALHLNLIANTTNVFYYNPSTDPYSPPSQMGQWNAQLQSTLTSVIGEANYDLGHLFGASGGGGNAGCIGCVCVNNQKGRGITSPADGIPQGDNFDIDYVAHEVGHQLGANHTFSMSLEGTGVNKEVGSGITIMGYAGITSQDVAPHSIDIFHEASIAQIQSNIETKTCPATVAMTANHAPVVGAVSNYIIPISTPFALTASATDQENDPLTYCWEQNDNSTTSGSNSVASPTKTTGPNWLSFPDTSSGTRLFPRLSTILAGSNVTGPLPGGDAGANIEALSSVSRTLNFRVTVRDNHPYVPGSTIGQTNFTDVVVTVTNTAGPFAVTSPNTNITWSAGSTATVTWNVNNTNTGSVNCANVNILLSTDGGNSFSMLLASTPNDGSQAVTVPNTPGNTNRIKVEAVGNIFFDISNANFTIGASSPCGDPTDLNETDIDTNSAIVRWNAVSGASNYDVQYKANSSSNWLNAVTGTPSLSELIDNLSPSTLYDWRVRANCSGGTSGSYVTDTFTTTAVGGATCPGAYDIEPNGTSGTAQEIPMNIDTYGRLGFAGDNDYYFFETSGGSITVSLTGLPANYQLALLSGSTTLQSSTNNGTAPESITRTVTAGTYFVRVYPKNNGAWNANLCYTLKVSGAAARVAEGRWITENGKRMSIFPNPAKALLNVSIDDLQDNTTLKVYNVMGKLVMQQQVSKTVTQINIAKLPAGVYMLNINDGNTVKSMKFVKE